MTHSTLDGASLRPTRMEYRPPQQNPGQKAVQSRFVAADVRNTHQQSRFCHCNHANRSLEKRVAAMIPDTHVAGSSLTALMKPSTIGLATASRCRISHGPRTAPARAVEAAFSTRVAFSWSRRLGTMSLRYVGGMLSPVEAIFSWSELPTELSRK